jgi:hypothetical protein
LGSTPGATLAVAGALAVIASTFREVWDQLSSAWSTPKPTLESLKADLKKQMTDHGRPVLAVVDDIDRLIPANVMRVLQVIRANADLPGLVFLVPFDRAVLARAVEQEVPGEGQSFLERFAQIPFDLPTLLQSDIDAMFFEVLEALGRRPEIVPQWSRAAFEIGYHRHLASYIGTPRRVAHIASTLPFMVGLHTIGPVFEVNLRDLIYLEVLRLFEPTVYQRLPGSADVLTGPSYGDDRGRERARQSLERVLSDVPEGDRRDRARQVLGVLFPAVEWASTGVNYHGDERRLLRERRVADPSMFPKYFLLAVPPLSLSEADLNKLLDGLGQDVPEIESVLAELSTRGLAGPLLDRLRGEPELVPFEHLADFIAALFNSGRALSDSMLFFGHASEILRAEFLIEEELELRPTEDRIAVLRRALDASSGTDLPVRLLRLQLHRHDINRDPVLPRADVESLLPELVRRIERDAQSGALLESQHIIDNLVAWQEWAPDAAATWIADALRRSDGLAAILRGHRSVTESTGDAPTVKKFSMRSIRKYEPLEELQDRARNFLQAGGLEECQRETLAAFVEAVDIHRQGRYSAFERFESVADDEAAGAGRRN